MTRSEREERSEQARIALLDLLPAGSTVYTILRDVSRSGMSRKIKCFIVYKQEWVDGREARHVIKDISMLVADALEYRMDKDHRGVIVQGCGMDMGFHLVSSLASFLGYSTGETKYQEHTNAYGLNHYWV